MEKSNLTGLQLKVVENSSQVNNMSYHVEDQILTITFKTGKSYQYFGVPVSHWEGLLSAESVGKYLNANIKPNYKFKAI